MKAIILAAGMSSRLEAIHGGRPKCLLQAGAETFIHRQIRLVRPHVDEIVVVTGFMADALRSTLADVTISHNPRYATTNNAVSLLLGLNLTIGHEVVVMNSDVYFEEGAIDLLVDAPLEDAALVQFKRCGPEEMKVFLSRNGHGPRITRVGKFLYEGEAAGEALGIWKFGSATCEHLRRELGMIGENLWFEHAVDILLQGHRPMMAVDVGRLFVMEVDTPADYALLLKRVRRERAASTSESVSVMDRAVPVS